MRSELRLTGTLKCLLGSLLLAGHAHAQVAASGTVTGRVLDPSEALISGARVTLTEERTGVRREAQTNTEGYYTFPLLGPGTYAVTVEQTGFRPTTRSGILLEIAQTARVDFRLELGSASQELRVTTEAPLLQTESGSVGQVINSITTVQLPLNGRNFTALAVLSPGVTSGGTNFFGATSNLRINGMRDSKTLFTLGGASITDQHFSGTRLLPPPDALEEFKLQTNGMPAEYGAGGGVVNIELKSGTNEIHGSLYHFLRNDKTDARNFFAARPNVLRQNQFGFTLGGPVRKNKTFLFGDYQGTRIRRGNTFNVPVATAAQKQGDFRGGAAVRDPQTGTPFPNNVIPANRILRPAAYFLQFMPDPNAGGNIYNRNASQVNDTNQFDIRADHVISSSDQLSGSYSYQRNKTAFPDSMPEVGARFQDFRTQLVTLRETHIFTPTLLNQFTASYYRNFALSTPQGLGTNHATAAGIGGFELTGATFPGFPGITITGFTGINGLAFYPLRNFQDTKLVGNNLTWVKGSHSFKGGVQFRWYRFTAYNAGTSRGAFTFNGTYTTNAFADYLLGIPFNGSRTFPRDLFGGFQRNSYFFFQDDWKVAPRLTLNIGLRYELNHARTPLHYQAATVDFGRNRVIVSSDDEGRINTTSQLATQFALPVFQDLIVTSKAAGLPSGLKFTPLRDFAPRFGFAWQAGAGFVLRGAYGIFYGTEEGNRQGSTQVGNVPVVFNESATFNTTPTPNRTMVDLFPQLIPGRVNTGVATFSDLEPYNPTANFQQWNLTLERSIGRGLTVEGGYVANKGTNVEFAEPRNIPLPGPGAIQARRPNPRWSSGNYIRNNSNSNYHSFQGKVEARAWRGLTLLGAYTWAKSIDYLSADPQASAVQDPLNIRAERGLSDFDVRQRGTASFVYDLPFLRDGKSLAHNLLGGWSVSGIVVAQTGLPFTPAIQTDPANTGTSRRPDRLAGGELSNGDITRWFDVAAFRLPAAFTFGNSGRNILRAPSFRNWNAGLFKEFSLGAALETWRIQFRAEAFNLTNTPQFGAPVANIQAPNAGRILSASEGREIQFALKLLF